MNWLLIAVILPAVVVAQHESNNPFRDAEKLIEIVNSNPNSTWTAGLNFNPDLPASYIKSLVSVRTHSSKRRLPRGDPITNIKPKDIPTTFDARKKWSHCKSLQTIRDQGNCPSSGAVAPASAFADRLCIASHGKINVHISQEEVLSCVYVNSCLRNCKAEYTWGYFVTHGVVTGGDYGSNEGCQPYSIKPCEHNITGHLPSCSSMGPVVTPNCHTICTNKKYSKSFNHDLKKAINAYSVDIDESSIQMEILTYGPVTANLYIYEDFIHYKSGVYAKNAFIKYLGHLTVKLIGWGVEDGVKYWLAQNSWNDEWGDKGLFKIVRGRNECGIESSILTGKPIV